MNSEREEFLKNNVLELAREHKKNCSNPDCGVSLFFVGSLILLADIELTEEESQELI